MKKLIFMMIFLTSFGSGFADSSDTIPGNIARAEAILSENGAENIGLQGADDVNSLKRILTTSNLFRFLLAMNSQLPDLTRVAEYVLLLNEMHQINEKLDTIALALQSANIQQARALDKGAI